MIVERSPAQRRAADPTHNAWVSASAGSGKTKVLVDRFLRLLLAGTAPDRVLCLTFTKAAAAEMADRLLTELAAWVTADDRALAASLLALTGSPPRPEDSRRARQLFAAALDVQGGLRIQTIHGFCETLLARFPIEAGLRPNFAVLDDRGARERLDDAQDVALLQAEHDSGLGAALARFAGRVAETRFSDLLVKLAAERARFARVLARGPEHAARRVRNCLGVAPGETAESIVDAACRDESFDMKALRRAAQTLGRGSKSDAAAGHSLATWLDSPRERGRRFDRYLLVYLTEEGEPRKRLATKQSIAAMPDIVEVLERERARLMVVLEKRRAALVAEATEALIVVGDAILRSYQDEKQRRNQLDYDDLVIEAVNLLRQPAIAPWILYKLDGGIDHVLVDEAQDTSPDQWSVIAALAEEFFAGVGARDAVRTLFAVGDEKQSIFSFQGADPATFAEMRGHFQGRIKGSQRLWQDVPMMLSYRSVPAVLSFADRLFGGSPAAGDGVTADGRWVAHQATRLGQAGLVELWPTVAHDEQTIESWGLPLSQNLLATAESRLARRIAGVIRRWLDSREMLTARARPIAPADILILVRRRNLFFEEMILALKQAGVPVAGADRMVLIEQLAVQDLIALARVTLLPEDDLVLATVLKSPFVGLTEEQLFHLAADRGARRLWEALRQEADRDPAYGAAWRFLNTLMARADFIPPYEFFAQVLSQGGRERLLARLGPEASDPIDEFLARTIAYQRENPPSLEGFLHWIEGDEVEIKRDMEQSRDQVRVMTVHGAKGLEAPIVFLPDTCTNARDDRSYFWTHDPEGGDLMLWPLTKASDDPVSARVRIETRREIDREYRRLFYVAVTRAADRLYICGWETGQGRGDGCWYELARPVMEAMGRSTEVDLAGTVETVWRYEEHQQTATEQLKLAAGAAVAPVQMPLWLRQPARPEAGTQRPLAPSRPAGSEAPVRRPLLQANARFRRGRIVHRLLQSLPAAAPDRRAEAMARYLALPGLALSMEEREAIAAETVAVLDDPAFAPIFAAHGLAEVPITGVVGATVVSGQVDRLLVETHEVLVVDFKSDRDPPDDGSTPESYVRQMAAYRAVLRGVYPSRAIRCALLWTAVPRLVEIGADRLDAAAP